MRHLGDKNSSPSITAVFPPFVLRERGCGWGHVRKQRVQFCGDAPMSPGACESWPRDRRATAGNSTTWAWQSKVPQQNIASLLLPVRVRGNAPLQTDARCGEVYPQPRMRSMGFFHVLYERISWSRQRQVHHVPPTIELLVGVTYSINQTRQGLRRGPWNRSYTRRRARAPPSPRHCP